MQFSKPILLAGFATLLTVGTAEAQAFNSGFIGNCSGTVGAITNDDTAGVTLIGTDADDVLNGGGGADTLIGGDGDDTYYINSPGVTVIELANGGSDTVVGAPRPQDVFGMSDGLDALTDMTCGLSDLAGLGWRAEGVERTMMDARDVSPLGLVDAGPVEPARLAMPISIDTDLFLDHRSVLTDYPLA